MDLEEQEVINQEVLDNKKTIMFVIENGILSYRVHGEWSLYELRGVLLQGYQDLVLYNDSNKATDTILSNLLSENKDVLKKIKELVT